MQFVAVDRYVVPTAGFRYPVDRETNGLVKRDEQIEQCKRDGAGIDEGRRYDYEYARMRDITKKGGLQPPVFPLNLFREPDLALAPFEQM